jgi:hypothetical protein
MASAMASAVSGVTGIAVSSAVSSVAAVSIIHREGAAAGADAPPSVAPLPPMTLSPPPDARHAAAAAAAAAAASATAVTAAELSSRVWPEGGHVRNARLVDGFLHPRLGAFGRPSRGRWRRVEAHSGARARARARRC